MKGERTISIGWFSLAILVVLPVAAEGLQAATVVLMESRGDANFTIAPRMSSTDLAQGIVPTSSPGTANEPLATLTNGVFALNYGPVFPNGVTTGKYKLDLGSVLDIGQINTYSFNQSGNRGQQFLSVYGSRLAMDPGFNPVTWTLIGSVDTRGLVTGNYNGTSIQDSTGFLGSYRWLLWSVSPISGAAGGENTSFQEFDVVAGQGVSSTADIPEPATLALLGLAASGLGGYIRRRRTA